MTNSREHLKYTMSMVIRQLEQLGIVWWIYDGYSIRRMHQTELIMESEGATNGSGSEDRVGESQPESRDDRGGEAALAAEDHDGVDGTRAAQPSRIPKPEHSLEARAIEKALARPERRRLPRKRRRTRR